MIVETMNTEHFSNSFWYLCFIEAIRDSSMYENSHKHAHTHTHTPSIYYVIITKNPKKVKRTKIPVNSIS